MRNLEYRLGDLESPPIEEGSIDLAFFSQSLHHALHPQEAVKAAERLLRPGGRIVILDLKKHGFERARELYADTWLGFSEMELIGVSGERGIHRSAELDRGSRKAVARVRDDSGARIKSECANMKAACL